MFTLYSGPLLLIWHAKVSLDSWHSTAQENSPLSGELLILVQDTFPRHKNNGAVSWVGCDFHLIRSLYHDKTQLVVVQFTWNIKQCTTDFKPDRGILRYWVRYDYLKGKYTMYPWSLHANLFMGGQCTLAMNLWRPYSSAWFYLNASWTDGSLCLDMQ